MDCVFIITRSTLNRTKNVLITSISVVVYGTLLFYYWIIRILRKIQQLVWELSWLVVYSFQQYRQACGRKPSDGILVDRIEGGDDWVTREEFQQLAKDVKILSEIVARHNIHLYKALREAPKEDP
ncbi:hypothetical protein Gasu2_07480 [Galdieria sulphuraria]|nr:hypothetical protein Gasu2_07480 [Galdieria sulphuraria]